MKILNINKVLFCHNLYIYTSILEFLTELFDNGIKFNCFNKAPKFFLVSFISDNTSTGTLAFCYNILYISLYI